MFPKIFLIFVVISGIGVFASLTAVFYFVSEGALKSVGYAVGALVGCIVSLFYFLQLNTMQNKINELEEKINLKKKDE